MGPGCVSVSRGTHRFRQSSASISALAFSVLQCVALGTWFNRGQAARTTHTIADTGENTYIEVTAVVLVGGGHAGGIVEPRDKPTAKWVLDRMNKTVWKKSPNLGDAQLFQFVPAYYPAVSVKESGSTFNDGGKYPRAVRNYEGFTAMGFLKWVGRDG